MKEKDSQYLQKLWIDWTKNKDKQAANHLIDYYMYLVQYHVERIGSYIPENYEKNDLKSLGLIGLYDALNKFEPKRNLKFDTYATIRIRGSIMDGLRKEDWLPRSLREQSKKIEKVIEELEQRLERTPDASDIAKELGMQPEEVESIMTNTLFANVISLDTPVTTNESSEESQIRTWIKDEKTVTPSDHIMQIEQKKELAEGIKKLNENEQLVISLFYQEELTLTEIGQILELTTSRISQIHKQAIFKLRNFLQKLETSY